MSEVARKVEFDKWLEVKDVHLTERGGAAAVDDDSGDHEDATSQEGPGNPKAMARRKRK